MVSPMPHNIVGGGLRGQTCETTSGRASVLLVFVKRTTFETPNIQAVSIGVFVTETVHVSRDAGEAEDRLGRFVMTVEAKP